jgi:hypothetical protein
MKQEKCGMMRGSKNLTILLVSILVHNTNIALHNFREKKRQEIEGNREKKIHHKRCVHL